MTISTTIDLSVVLNSTQGFAILGGTAYDRSGYSVSAAGDVNKDGYADIIIGAPYASPSSRTNAGKSYVIYGSSGNPGTIDLSVDLSNTQGFTILGGAPDEQSGWSVSTAGDINGDGYADIVIGVYYKSYVIYGSSINPGTIDLKMPLSSAQGFAILTGGGNTVYHFGWSVNAAGDVNGDGYADIIVVGAPYKSYVIYGNSINPGTVYLSALSSTQGFAILSYYTDMSADRISANSAGDVNNDGYTDIIIGVSYASPNSKRYAGQSYVIYGGSTNPGTIDLSALSSTQGFAILGGASYDQSGYSVSTAGDVNNDGYADIIIGAPVASPNSRSYAGQSYVIYGSSTNPGTIDLTVPLDSTQGFAILGGTKQDLSGWSVSTAGDINNDGYADIIIGASSSTGKYGHQSYVIYGSITNPGTIDSSVLNSMQGFVMLGNGFSVSYAGDVNNDGYADIIVGAYGASPNSRSDAGQSSVIYGGKVNPISQPTGHPTSQPTSQPTRQFTLAPSKIHATFALEVYNDNSDTATLQQVNGLQSRIPSGWIALPDAITVNIGTADGFFARVYKNRELNSAVISFRGTVLNSVGNLDNDRQLLLGNMPDYYSSMVKFVDFVTNKLNCSGYSFTGHSLGAFLAQLASSTYGKQAVVFESPGVETVINSNFNNPSL